MGLVPTGGTTGPAKGVMVTNLAWGTMTEMAGNYWSGDAHDRICLTSAPLSHAAGVVAFVMTSLGAASARSRAALSPSGESSRFNSVTPYWSA